MYRFLCSNVETLKERGLEAKTNEVTLIALDEDIEKGIENPTIYAFRNGRIYDPNDDFKPNTPRGHKLEEGSQLVADYWDQLATAKFKYKTILKNEGNKGSGEKNEENAEALARKEKELDAQSRLIAEQAKLIEEMKRNAPQGEARHEKFDTILEILSDKVAVYMHGEAGTGKSMLAEQVAKELELDFYPVSTVTQEFKLTGFIDANGTYHETNFYKAVKNGGLFFIDEMDSCSADVLLSINGTLANGYFDFPHETVKQHKDFVVIGAGNTIGRGGNEEYTGRQALDISTLDRFMAVPIGYSMEIDRAVAKGDQELVEFAHSLRKASKDSDISILMSYRAIDRIVKFKDRFDLVDLLNMALIKGLDKEDMRMLSRNMTITSNNEYYQAFKKAI